MNVKLTQGQSGPGCGRLEFFIPGQIIKCSDAQGARWIGEGMAVKASPDAEIDGEHFERTEPEASPRRGKPEHAVRPTPQTPESGKGSGSDGLCQGETKQGNHCKREAGADSKFCDKHQDQAKAN